MFKFARDNGGTARYAYPLSVLRWMAEYKQLASDEYHLGMEIPIETSLREITEKCGGSVCMRTVKTALNWAITVGVLRKEPHPSKPGYNILWLNPPKWHSWSLYR